MPHSVWLCLYFGKYFVMLSQLWPLGLWVRQHLLHAVPLLTPLPTLCTTANWCAEACVKFSCLLRVSFIKKTAILVRASFFSSIRNGSGCHTRRPIREGESKREKDKKEKRKCCCYIYAQVSHKPPQTKPPHIQLDDDDSLQIVITQNGSLQFPTWRKKNAIPYSKLSAEKSKRSKMLTTRIENNNKSGNGNSQLRQRVVCVFNPTKKSNMTIDTGRSCRLANRKGKRHDVPRHVQSVPAQMSS